MTELFVRSKARQDLAEAADHYAQSETDLRFIAAWDAAQRRIRPHPGSGVSVDAVLLGLRRLGIKGFPYGIFYTLDAERIDVLRVLHEHRDTADLIGGDPGDQRIEPGT